MIVSGFCKEVFRELPMEFAVEAQKLLSVTLKEALASTTADDRELARDCRGSRDPSRYRLCRSTWVRCMR